MKMKSIMNTSQGVGGLKESHQARAGGKGTESPRPTRSVVLPRNGSLLGRTPASGAKLGYDNLDYGKIGERKESEGRLRPRRQRQDVKKTTATPCPDCGRMFDKQVGLSVHQARWCKQRVGCNEAERQEYTASDSKSSSAQHHKVAPWDQNRFHTKSEPPHHFISDIKAKAVTNKLALLAQKCSYVIWINRFNKEFQTWRL